MILQINLTPLEKQRMLTPKFKKYADRIRELIDIGNEIATLPKSTLRSRPYIQGADKTKVYAWNTSVRNILQTTFGAVSPHFHQYKIEVNDGKNSLQYAEDIYPIVGILVGALSDLESGFLIGQEYLIAGDLFDDVLEQAKYLNANGHKDPAAILARTVLEDALKRIARSEGLDDSKKASMINQDLWKHGRYAKPQWRLIDSWLDIGNSAAHGKFDEYDEEKVKGLAEDIGKFLVQEFRP